MSEIKKSRLTTEQILKAVSACRTLKEFKKLQRPAFRAARYRGMLPEITQHMPDAAKFMSEITNEDLAVLAGKYQSAKEWRAADTVNYKIARFRGLARKLFVDSDSID